MRICTNASEFRRAIKVVRPSRIAVAYLGDGWEKIVDSSRLREVIVAPVLGSNPHAIESLANTLGFENVHFLDNLHAKIYIGQESALLGSANLSVNGFSDGGNHEIGVHLNGNLSMGRLNTTFLTLKRAASKAYPNTGTKQLRLTKLYREWQRAYSEGLQHTKVKPVRSPKEMSRHVVWHLCWYSEYGLEYNEQAVHASIPESIGENLDDFIADNMSLLENDKVQEGDWILYWKCNAKGIPLVRGGLDWLFVPCLSGCVPQYRKQALRKAGRQEFTGLAAYFSCLPAFLRCL